MQAYMGPMTPNLELELIEKSKRLERYERVLREVRVDLETISKETVKVLPALKLIEDALKTAREVKDILDLIHPEVVT